jgi:hypothetical protein
MADIKEEVKQTKIVKPTERDLKWESDRLTEKVTGVIRNNENPGNPIEFWFRGPGCPDTTKFSYKDNETITIPMGVAKHVNKSCFVEVDQYKLDAKGTPTLEAGKKMRRFSFFPFGYVDTEDLSEVGIPMIKEV